MELTLRIGKAVVIFPEGTLGKAKKGVSSIVDHSDVPTIPVFLKGAECLMPRGAKFIRPAKLSVTFGPPICSRHTFFSDLLLEWQWTPLQ